MELDYTKYGLIKLLNQHKYLLVLDIEHTCTEDGSIPPNEREIIEIGAVLVCAETFSILSEFNRLVRPVRHPVLSAFCSQLTGISQFQLTNEGDFSQAFEEFKTWLPDDYIFSAWGSYDLIQINIDSSFHGLGVFKPSAVVNLKKGFAKTQRIKPRVGLRRALEVSGLSPQGTQHRALNDAKSTVRLLPFIFEKSD